MGSYQVVRFAVLADMILSLRSFALLARAAQSCLAWSLRWWSCRTSLGSWSNCGWVWTGNPPSEDSCYLHQMSSLPSLIQLYLMAWLEQPQQKGSPLHRHCCLQMKILLGNTILILDQGADQQVNPGYGGEVTYRTDLEQKSLQPLSLISNNHFLEPR